MATGVTTGVECSNSRSRSTITTCLVSASYSALPDAGPHQITRCKNEAFHRNVAIRMELSRALSIVFREQDACEPFLFMTGHRHHEVVTVNEQSNISFHVHKQRGIAEILDETMFFQDLYVTTLAKEHWRPLYSRSCPFSHAFIWEVRKHSSHGYSMESQGFVCLSPLFDCERRTESGVPPHLQKCIPLKSLAAEGTSYFFMAFLVSLTTNRDL